MDGCYWSGGSEIKWGQLDQRGDAGSISLARFVIIPSSPMRDVKAEADAGRRVAFIGSPAQSARSAAKPATIGPGCQGRQLRRPK